MRTAGTFGVSHSATESSSCILSLIDSLDGIWIPFGRSDDEQKAGDAQEVVTLARLVVVDGDTVVGGDGKHLEKRRKVSKEKLRTKEILKTDCTTYPSEIVAIGGGFRGAIAMTGI